MPVTAQTFSISGSGLTAANVATIAAAIATSAGQVDATVQGFSGPIGDFAEAYTVTVFNTETPLTNTGSGALADILDVFDN